MIVWIELNVLCVILKFWAKWGQNVKKFKVITRPDVVRKGVGMLIDGRLLNSVWSKNSFGRMLLYASQNDS